MKTATAAARGTFRIRGCANDVAEFRRRLDPRRKAPVLTKAARRFWQLSGLKPTHMLVRLAVLTLLLALPASASELSDASARAKAAGKRGGFSAVDSTAQAGPNLFPVAVPPYVPDPEPSPSDVTAQIPPLYPYSWQYPTWPSFYGNRQHHGGGHLSTPHAGAAPHALTPAPRAPSRNSSAGRTGRRR